MDGKVEGMLSGKRIVRIRYELDSNKKEGSSPSGGDPGIDFRNRGGWLPTFKPYKCMVRNY